MSRKRLPFERSLFALPGEFIESVARRELELFGLQDFDPFAPLRCLSHPELYEHESVTATGLTLNLDWARSTTLYPLYACTGTEPSLEQCVPRDCWRICTECVRLAVEVYGISYVHRAHVFPRVQVCHHHGLRLYDHCPCCGTKISRHSLAAFETCVRNYVPVEPSSDDSVEWEFSRFVAALVHSETPAISLHQVLSVIYERLLIMGYGEQVTGVGSPADLHLGRIYRDCNLLLPRSLVELEWLDGKISQKTLIVLLFFACRDATLDMEILSAEKSGVTVSLKLISLIPVSIFSEALKRRLSVN